MTLETLRKKITALIEKAGGPKLFAERVGLTASAWSNITNDPARRPGQEMLKILGYVEQPPSYRKLSNHTK